ncbi:MAG: carbohydrate ABC transporter permease [Thermotoga sp.]|nr:MAG: carbohydrate ABC transporter permease [Thermotoga sp.]
MKRRKSLAYNIFRFTMLGIYLLFAVFPFYWLFVTSIKTEKEVYSFPVDYFPKKPTLINYINVWMNSRFPRYFLNSGVVALVSSTIVTFTAILGAYSLARYNFKFKSQFLIFFLITQMFPLILFIVPLYIIFSKLKLINTLTGLILVYTSFNLPFSLFLMRGFIEGVPKEIEESALIDGCGRFRMIMRIVIPIIRPGVFATFAFAFTGAWNEMLFALMFLNSEKKLTIPVFLSMFVQKYDVSWGEMSAAALISLIPVAVMFAWIQKYLVRGLAMGAVKG